MTSGRSGRSETGDANDLFLWLPPQACFSSKKSLSTVTLTAAILIISTETWLSSGIGDCELLLSNLFQIFRKDRTQSRGGGVTLAVSRLLKASVMSIECDLLVKR